VELLDRVGVGGVVADFVSNFICTGGASSGEHCGIQVPTVNEFVNVGHVIWPETRAALPAGQCAVAPGDSDRPAYSYRSDGRVDARGTNSAGIIGTATCPGDVPNGSNTVWYAPLLWPTGDPQIGSLQHYGVGILSFGNLDAFADGSANPFGAGTSGSLTLSLKATYTVGY